MATPCSGFIENIYLTLDPKCNDIVKIRNKGREGIKKPESEEMSFMDSRSLTPLCDARPH